MPYSHNNECSCFDSFNAHSHITHLTVGDVNQHFVDKRRMEMETERLNEEIKSKDALINTLMSSSYAFPKSPLSRSNSYVSTTSTASPSYSVPNKSQWS